MCNQVCPAIVYFSGKKIKAVLKFHTNVFDDASYVNHANLLQFIENEKNIQKGRKLLIQEHEKITKPLLMQLIQMVNKLNSEEEDHNPPIDVFKSISRPLTKKSKFSFTTKEYDHEQRYTKNSQLPYRIVSS